MNAKIIKQSATAEMLPPQEMTAIYRMQQCNAASSLILIFDFEDSCF